ncbi:MAG: hypothetical protein MUC60_06825 [Oscillatoria sp. Prado101]|nr:hypothetical protein [Oscillatoria sp. Prado101]
MLANNLGALTGTRAQGRVDTHRWLATDIAMDSSVMDMGIGDWAGLMPVGAAYGFPGS